MAKVDIISGFLGAGKTTLIKKLIKEAFPGEQLVLIENEFGEIGVDGDFLKNAGVKINELNAGCICCSLVGDFSAALKQVITDYSPDRVIIEPSGVGKLSDVIGAIQKTSDEVDIELNSASTVVDVTKAKMYIKNFGEFFLNQIDAAGCVILSRSQNVSAENMDEVVGLIREHNAEARIVTTPWDDIDGKKILEAIEHSTSVEDMLANFHVEDHDEDECDDPNCSCHHHHHDHDEEGHEHHHHHEDECDDPECSCHHHHDEDEHHDHEHHHHHHDHECDDPNCSCHDHHHHHHHGHDADDVFISWGKETAKKYSRDALNAILEQLQVVDENPFGFILRAKGIVPDEDGKWLEFDLTPGEFEIREGAADYTGKLCVIGSNLNEEKISELFGVN